MYGIVGLESSPWAVGSIVRRPTDIVGKAIRGSMAVQGILSVRRTVSEIKVCLRSGRRKTCCSIWRVSMDLVWSVPPYGTVRTHESSVEIPGSVYIFQLVSVC
jgi:hypothetical protein